METNQTETLAEITSLTKTHFKMLQEEGGKKKYLTAKIAVGGYTDMMFIVTDLIKASILALEAEEPFASREIRNPASNVCGLLDLALQLIPYEEIEVLDALHKLKLQQEQEESAGTDTKISA